jgi:hypothetical protein
VGATTATPRRRIGTLADLEAERAREDERRREQQKKDAEVRVLQRERESG